MLFGLSLCRQLILVCITILVAASASFSGASCHVAYDGAPSGHNREGLMELKTSAWQLLTTSTYLSIL